MESRFPQSAHCAGSTIPVYLECFTTLWSLLLKRDFLLSVDFTKLPPFQLQNYQTLFGFSFDCFLLWKKHSFFLLSSLVYSKLLLASVWWFQKFETLKFTLQVLFATLEDSVRVQESLPKYWKSSRFEFTKSVILYC